MHVPQQLISIDEFDSDVQAIAIGEKKSIAGVGIELTEGQVRPQRPHLELLRCCIFRRRKSH